MTLNELKILLALNGNERIEYAEAEIFADVELYTCYLESICSKYTWYKDYNNREVKKVVWLAYMYSSREIGGRWLEVESVIAKSRNYAIWYNLRFGADI